MSDSGSASSVYHQGGGSSSKNGRPNVSPKYPSSTLATCLTSPNRFVPVGVSGRRMSYSESPSSFHNRASRASCRYRRRSAFGFGSIMPGSLAPGTDNRTPQLHG